VRAFLPFIFLGLTLVMCSIDAVAEFAPINIAQALQLINDNLQGMNDRLNFLTAMGFNNRVLMRNVHRRAPHPLLPLHKTVRARHILPLRLLMVSPGIQIPGHGLALAQAVAHNMAARNALVPPAQVPVVGTTPPNFVADLHTYRHHDILELILFYNDDFGIVQADTLPSRIESFRRFLVEV